MRAKEKAERAQQEEPRAAVVSIERVRKKIKYLQQHLIRYLFATQSRVPSSSQWVADEQCKAKIKFLLPAASGL
jgi:hypothetical protein